MMEHAKGCNCRECDAKILNGYPKTEPIFEDGKHLGYRLTDNLTLREWEEAVRRQQRRDGKGE